MKLQNMAVLFVIIIIPIVLVMSAYIQAQVDTIALQTQYDNLLRNATYDSIKAMQLNTLNDQFSNVADSKRRDIKAAINVYMNSLSTGLGVSGYSDEYIKPFTPALVYTLYDGYYIYSPTNATGNLEYILKPYSYYSEKVGDYIICYTLDNYVTIYGDFGNGYEQKSGYLLNKYSGNGGIIKYSYNGKTAYKYNGVTIEENCESSLYELNTSGNKGSYNNDTYSKNYAYKFCKEAFDFSTIIWNNATLKKHFNLGGSNAYLTSPENPQSQFNEHRREVIKASIESNIKQAFTEYNSISGMAHEFRIPVITEEEWDLVLNNVSMISFFQGLPVGTKYYNNYAIVTNTLNKEFVDPNGLRFTNTKQDSATIEEETYHKINCESLYCTGFIIGYRNVDLEKWPYTYKTESATGEITSETRYYYKHKNVLGYECLVDSNESNNIDAVDEDEKKNAFWITLARERYKQHYVGTITSSTTNAGTYKAPRISGKIINMEDTSVEEGTYFSGQYVKDKYVKLEFSNPMGYDSPKYQISKDGGTTWGDVSGSTYLINWGTVSKESQTGEIYKVRYNQGDLSISNESNEFEVKIKLLKYYTVKYDGNGNTAGITESTKHAIGENSTIAINKFSKTGYLFTTWNTKKAGTGKNYNSGQQINEDLATEGNIITLYAQWNPITYKIEYNGNGATSGSTASSSHTYDKSKALTANGYSKVGYTFDGWTTKSDGTGTKYTDKQNVKNLTTTNGATVTLYAKWKTTEYTISYNLNGGTVTGNPSTYTVKDTVTLKTPTKTGYEFLGWTGSNGTTPSTSVTIPKGSTGNKEYTAYWKPKTIVVTFMRNISSTDTTSATQTFAYGVGTQKFSAKNWTNPGYKLTGWINKENNRKYTVESSVLDTWIDEFSPKVTLHAIWEADGIKVTFNVNGNGGTCSTTSKTVTYGNTYGTLPTPTRKGYTFAGWYTASSGGTRVYSTTTVKNASNHTLYAHWTANKYTVTFDPTGGTCSPTSKTVTYGSTYGDLPTPTKTGYTFAGWYTASSGGTRVYPTTTVTNANNHTLYAHWTQVPTTSISISDGDTWIANNGSTVTLKATVSPTNAASATWTSSSTSVATVSESGKVTAISAGRTQITATSGGKSASIYVYVYNAHFNNPGIWIVYSDSSCNSIKSYVTTNQKFVLEKMSNGCYKINYSTSSEYNNYYIAGFGTNWEKETYWELYGIK